MPVGLFNTVADGLVGVFIGGQVNYSLVLLSAWVNYSHVLDSSHLIASVEARVSLHNTASVRVSRIQRNRVVPYNEAEVHNTARVRVALYNKTELHNTPRVRIAPYSKR